MEWVKFIIYAYIAVVLQTAFLPVAFPDYLRPWALVILADRYLLSKSAGEGSVLIVWVIGLLADLTSISPLGSQALAYGLYGLLILIFRPVLFTDSPLAHAVTCFTGVITITAVYAILTVFSRQALPLPFSVMEVVGQAIITGLVAAAITKLFVPARRHALGRR